MLANSFNQNLIIQPKIIFKQKVLSIICVISILSLLIPLHFIRSITYEKSDSDVSKTLPQEKILPETPIKINDFQKNKGLPKKLKIPTLKIDAAIEYVGIKPDGSMDVPKNINNVAWLKSGPRPGDKGSAVIAGHSGWFNKNPAVFNNLQNLKTGDIIYVEDDSGQLIPFVVKEKRFFDPLAEASIIFNHQAGYHLNLITCAGKWDEKKKTYDRRLVIFTDLITNF